MLIDISIFSLFAFASVHCRIIFLASLKAGSARCIERSRWSRNYFRIYPPGSLLECLEWSTRASAVKDYQFFWSVSRAVEHLLEWLLCPYNVPEWRGVARQVTELRGTKRLFCFSRRRLEGRLKFLLSFFLLYARLEEIHIWCRQSLWICVSIFFVLVSWRI